MVYILGAYTDVGILKDTNQDSILIEETQINGKSAVIGVICDGMGGLESGEVASSTLAVAIKSWFENECVKLLVTDFQPEQLYGQIRNLLVKVNNKIIQYGKERGINLGTTLSGILIWNNSYYVVNVGDSRVYLINDRVNQLTKDQTYVQREIDQGRMTYEEAENSISKSVLLQCVGATEIIYPDFYQGQIHTNDVFMFCSDGFRHVITDSEIYEYLNNGVISSQDDIVNQLRYLVDLNKYRNEEDNITAGVIIIH